MEVQNGVSGYWSLGNVVCFKLCLILCFQLLQDCFSRWLPPDVCIASPCRSTTPHARRWWLLVSTAQLGDANPFFPGIHNVLSVINETMLGFLNSQLIIKGTFFMQMKLENLKRYQLSAGCSLIPLMLCTETPVNIACAC